MNTFAAYKEQFSEHLKILNRSPRTIDMYERFLQEMFEYFLWKKINSIKDVTYKCLRNFQRYLDKRGNSIQTIYMKVRVMKQFFGFLENNDQLLLDPANRLILPELPDRLPQKVLTSAEMKKLLNAPDMTTPQGIRDKAMLELLYSTAIRRAECVNLKINDVNISEGILRINQGKGAKDRMVPLGSCACFYLQKYFKEVRSARIDANKDNGALFIKLFRTERNKKKKRRNKLRLRNGEPLGVSAVVRIVRNYGFKVLGKNVAIHAIRRSCATHMIKAGIEPIYVQKLLGHSTNRTVQHYVRLSIHDLKKAHAKTHPREKEYRKGQNK